MVGICANHYNIACSDSLLISLKWFNASYIHFYILATCSVNLNLLQNIVSLCLYLKFIWSIYVCVCVYQSKFTKVCMYMYTYLKFLLIRSNELESHNYKNYNLSLLLVWLNHVRHNCTGLVGTKDLVNMPLIWLFHSFLLNRIDIGLSCS